MNAGRLARHPLTLFGIALYVFPYLVVALGKGTFNASEFLVWAIFATGINVLWGHTGDLSFGPALELELKGLSGSWRVHKMTWR